MVLQLLIYRRSLTPGSDDPWSTIEVCSCSFTDTPQVQVHPMVPGAPLQTDLLSPWADKPPKVLQPLIPLDLVNKPGEGNIVRHWLYSFQSAASKDYFSESTLFSSSAIRGGERALSLLELSRAIKDFLEALGAAAALVITLMFCKFQGGLWADYAES